MNRKLSVIFLLSFSIAQFAGAQIITKPEDRSALIGGMNQTLANMEQQERAYDSVGSPFIAVMPKKEVKVVEKVIESDEPVVVEILPDAQALSIISQQFKPLGSLILGNRGVLQLQDNSTIERGATFKAAIKGHTYEVQIFDVTSRGYTLKLGSAQITKNFLTTSGTAQ